MRDSKKIKSIFNKLFFAYELSFLNFSKFLNWGNIISTSSKLRSSSNNFKKFLEFVNFLNSSNNLSLDNFDIPSIFLFIILIISGLCLCFE